MRLLGFGALLPLVLVALSCGSNDASPAPPSTGPRPPLPPVTLGVIDLSGAVYGSASIDASPCPTMGTLLLVLAGATSDGDSYALQVRAPKSGVYTFRRGTRRRAAAIVQLLDETREGRRWAAGLTAAPGFGKLDIKTNRVSVDAVLDGRGRTRGTVHVRGLWPCS